MPRLGSVQARERFRAARVARLATVTPDGAPHVVPIVFAVRRDRVVFAVDHKPKSTQALRRLDNIAAHPRVAVLADEYDDDWSRLWWVRADGMATVHRDAAELAGIADLADALRARYEQYVAVPPSGPFVVIEVSRWSGWAASPAGEAKPG